MDGVTEQLFELLASFKLLHLDLAATGLLPSQLSLLFNGGQKKLSLLKLEFSQSDFPLSPLPFLSENCPSLEIVILKGHFNLEGFQGFRSACFLVRNLLFESSCDKEEYSGNTLIDSCNHFFNDLPNPKKTLKLFFNLRTYERQLFLGRTGAFSILATETRLNILRYYFSLCSQITHLAVNEGTNFPDWPLHALAVCFFFSSTCI